VGIEPYWSINHGPTLSFYYRDPDGNQIELQIDIYEDAKSTNDWFAQSDFDTNFIGVKFVPEDLIRRYREGEARETLLARPVIDPSELGAQFPGPA
jgi:catechol-2,3-dioxygenase